MNLNYNEIPYYPSNGIYNDEEYLDYVNNLGIGGIGIRTTPSVTPTTVKPTTTNTTTTPKTTTTPQTTTPTLKWNDTTIQNLQESDMYEDYQATPYDKYTMNALDYAQGLMGKSYAQYPSYVSSQQNAPTQSNFYNYSPTDPMTQVNVPNYQYTADSATPWQNWTAKNAPSYGTVGTNAQTADWKWNNYNVAAPTYNSLMRGDYDALQQALTTPGQIEAQNAYNQGMVNLNAAMSGQGLYGSSMMGNQMNQGLNREYMNALSTNSANAAATRYGMEQQDLTNMSAQELAAWQAKLNESITGNSAGLDYAKLKTQTNVENVNRALEQAQALNALKSSDYQTLQGLLANQNLAKNTYNQEARAQDLTRESDLNKYNAQNFATDVTQQKNIWNANALETANKQAYDASKLAFNQEQSEALRNWKNQQAYEKYSYNLAKNAYQNQLQEAQMNQALSLAGQGAPLSQMANNYSLAQQQLAAAQDQASSASTAGWLQGSLGLLGGLLGTGTGNGNTIGGDLYNRYFGNTTS
jgi:hypothetical protein